MKKNEIGITLISLVITIIVLLILASVATYSGLGTVRNSKFTRFRAELEIMQAQVDLLNQKYSSLPDSEKDAYIQGIGKALSELDEVKKSDSFTGAGVTSDVEIAKYKYFDKETLEGLDIQEMEREFLVNIYDRKIIAIEGIQYEGEKYYTLEQITGSKTEVGGLQRTGYVTVEDVTYEKIDTGYRITLKNIQCTKYVAKYSVKYKEQNQSSYKTIETEATGSNYSFDVERPGIYYIKVEDAAGRKTEKEEIVVSVYGGTTFLSGEKVKMVKTISDTEEITTEEVAIPAKFTISGKAEECAQTTLGVTNERKYTIDDGVVLYLLNGETVNWNDETEITNAQKKYDQFVWVPVANAVLDLSSNSTVLSSEENIKSAVQSEINAGRYPMAIKKDETDYFGVLYQFSLDNSTNTVEIELHTRWTPLTTANYREPAYLEYTSWGDGSDYNDVIPKVSQELLQSEFNTMIGKVSNNKGFWVGRYETSNMVADNTKDTTNRVTIIKDTTTGISDVTWYRMYAQQKSYSKLALGSNTTATSSMIWGSQWDQIMIWMKEEENESQNSKYIVNSIGMGNYGTISEVDDGWSSITEPAPTGYKETYKVKNVYDLAGNVFDWSLEANSTNSRILRGGYYNNVVNSPFYKTTGYVPANSYGYIGSRSTLY